MPRQGNGTYALPANTWFPGVNLVTATTADWNATAADIQAALTQSVSSDGQTPMTGNLPMGNNKITGLANATAITDAAALGQVVRNIGQCRLTKSGSNLMLSPYQGNQIAINGALYTIPSAGVTLAPGAVTPSTLYYIYAYLVGAVITLEASTTGHSTDISTGVETKTGDATRTLVGMARPIAGPLWQDAANQRFVVSWFNPRPISLSAGFTANRGYTSSTTGEVNAEIRNEFLNWANSALSSKINMQGGHSTTGSTVDTWIGVDGSQVDALASFQQSLGGSRQSSSVLYEGTTTEGYHYTTLMADNPSGAGSITYNGGVSGSVRCTLYTTIQG